jgi:hypothetical protein
MARKGQADRIGEVIGEVEALAKRLGKDLRKRAQAAGIQRDLRAMAGRLRKQAASVAAQVEKHVHEIRRELERSSKTANRARSKKHKPAAAS